MRLTVAMLVVVALTTTAFAKEKDARRRKVAVLEYRAGAAGAAQLGLRMALILRNLTSLEVLDPDDARQKLGSKVDEDLAKCAGDVRCVAGIGARLGAQEVLLVGVSELGDLILALQLVDVKSKKVTARIAESLAPDAEPDDGMLEGYLRRLMPRGDFLRYGTIKVIANVTGASVIVGGEPRGVTPIEPITVEAPKRYDIRVRKSGYGDFTASVDVPPDAVVEVRPELQKRAGPSVTSRWWFWAIAGTVVTGAVVGGIMLTQDDPTSVPIGTDPF